MYKNGLLLESRDGGRHWSEIPGSLFGFGAYRWSVSWGADDVLVLVGLAGAEWDERPELKVRLPSSSHRLMMRDLHSGTIITQILQPLEGSALWNYQIREITPSSLEDRLGVSLLSLTDARLLLAAGDPAVRLGLLRAHLTHRRPRLGHRRRQPALPQRPRRAAVRHRAAARGVV